MLCCLCMWQCKLFYLQLCIFTNLLFVMTRFLCARNFDDELVFQVVVMADDSNAKRNFRVTFYDKVAPRPSGEKELAAILKFDVIDLEKLKNFCLRFSVQESYRHLIWKILLDVLPPHQQSHSFVAAQRKEQYDDLYHALEVLRLIEDDMSLPILYLKMLLLERGELCFGYQAYPWHLAFLSVAASIVDMVDDPADCYWISVRLQFFFEKLNLCESSKDFDVIVVSIVERESKKLYLHLDGVNFFPSDIVKQWHERGFSSLFSFEGCLEHIWDIALGGGYTILPHLSAHLLLVMERNLLKLDALPEVEKYLGRVPLPCEIADLACRRAIESWRKSENIA